MNDKDDKDMIDDLIEAGKNFTKNFPIKKVVSSKESEKLRDRFAMAALTGMWANKHYSDVQMSEMARLAYQSADLMLKIRNA